MTRKHVKLGAVVAAVVGALFAGMSISQAEGSDDPTGGGGRAHAAAKLSGAGSDSELVYRSITPCRAVDTRNAGGAMSTAAVRTFSAVSGLGAQGGNAADCGVPASAAGITANVTVTGTVGTGYLTVFPNGAIQPTASAINWFASGQTLANEIHVGLGSGSFKVFNGGGSNTHVVVDITGYNVQQLHATVNSDGIVTYSTGTGRIVSASKTGTGAYQVTFDRDVSGDCSPTVSVLSNNSGYATFTESSAVVSVKTFNGVGSPTDQYFAITALC
jgi:hypothetical protein